MLQIPFVDFLSNGTAKTKLTMLALCRVCEKPSYQIRLNPIEANNELQTLSVINELSTNSLAIF